MKLVPLARGGGEGESERKKGKEEPRHGNPDLSTRLRIEPAITPVLLLQKQIAAAPAARYSAPNYGT